MTDEGTMPFGWLDDDEPHDPEHAAAQLAGLETLLEGAPRRVLDLGSGAGRVLVPLAQRGHELIGLDRSPEAIERCAQELRDAEAAASLLEADFTDPSCWPSGPFDAVLCLGNTFMELHDVDEAVTVLEAAADVLGPEGVMVIDDIPADLWPELAEGFWQAGQAETPEGPVQLVWAPADTVYALRSGEEIEDAPLLPTERRFRLWTDGALRLAARAAGLSTPERVGGSHLIVMAKPAAGGLAPEH